MDELEHQLLEAQVSYEQCVLERTTAENHAQVLEQRLSEVTAALQQAVDEVGRKEEGIHAAQEASASLAKQLQAARTKVEKSDAVNHFLEIEIQGLRSQLEESHKRTEDAERALDDARRRAGVDKQTNDAANMRLRNELANARVAYATVRDQFQVLGRHATDLEAAARRHMQETGCCIQ